ncbi:lysosome membrane protein 2-like [Cimex lectularius]|uniref:Scavenger receptor class B member 1 n=1 Tax=Cimex lectularius TaxID=79782 RepID=A0A8I6S7I0_CIMLE|nr:lysosome membrane protein 2-like [Cimex lectularius]XP_024083381.1 lysosome membrane protein 2-like [Cimex lectularius]
MGSLRTPSAETFPRQEKNGKCIPKLLNHFGQMFSRSACPSEKRNSRATSQLVNGIECEPLRQGEAERQDDAYKDIDETTIQQSQRSQWMNKGFIVALLLAVLSLGINYVMWFTNAYDNAVLKLISIRNDIDTVFEMWKMPPTKTHLSVYIFNYTNHEAWLKGDDKVPHVKEIGPLVFREQMERINIHFNDNHTVSYQEKKTITFVPELTPIPLNTTIWVPNVLFIALMKLRFQNYAFYMEQKVLQQFFDNDMKLFKNITLNQVIWGFEDDLLNFGTKFFSPGAKPPMYGFLAKRQGEHSDILTMKTGHDDLSTIGSFTRWNGKKNIGAWGNTECDEIEGSDGTIFPANLVKEKKPLHVFLHDMCRTLPIFFNKSTTSVDGFPVHQYNVHEEMFNYQREEYSCFKRDGKHAPDGVFNTAPCHKDIPLYASFPHFWKGGDIIKNHIVGLHPDAQKHRSYFQIHKDLGICLLAKMRFQLNIKFEKYIYMQFSEKVSQNEIILPFGWLDFDSGELPENFVNVLYHLTFTVKTVKEILKYTFLLLFTLSLAFVGVFITKNVRRNAEYQLHTKNFFNKYACVD